MTEQDFSTQEDINYKKLVEERIAWRQKHPKPWYLVNPKIINMSLNTKNKNN